MKKRVDISVSADPISDYQNIIEYAKQMQGVADFLHCDVMNENFVSKNTYDFNLVKSVNLNSAIMLDVHLMVNEPLNDVPKYIEAGANIVTVHYEAFENKEDLVNVLKYIQENDTLAGISLKPGTPFKDVRSFAFNCDVILVMGVEPGASGQKILDETYDKVREIYEFRQSNNLNFKIEFDGGVNPETAKKLIECGVDILVSGTYVYNSKNRQLAVQELRGEEQKNY